ncbi:MAG: serine--tRNA ligase [Acidimicrobiia bacterium]|nr:serine--tRNA ligase [Acidimicrobiia bacterium]
MLDPRRLRTELDVLKKGLARRGIDTSVLDRAAELDERQRHAVARRDELRSRVNALSKEVGEAFRTGDKAAGERKREESKALGEDEKQAEADARALQEELRDIMLRVPNIPADEAPEGTTAEDNVVARVEDYDEGAYAEHQRAPHWDIGAELGILDLPRGAKLSGSMFPMFRGEGAALLRALCQLALDRNADAFEEIRPPTLVRTETMVSTGHLPKFDIEAYHVERDDLWAIPTAEVPLTGQARDEILDAEALPVRLMAYSPCFRREAGAAGRDTRGLLRVHEFDKVELYAFCTPEQAAGLHTELLARAEGSLRALGLPYRVLDLAAGDLGDSSRRTFDLEVYAPGCDMWLEVSSVSWCGDYQARRANVRYRTADGTAMVHTLNGSALATPRVWAAVVETYRQPDGSVRVPDALKPYMRGVEVIGARPPG